jgi:hypothetical protein
LVISQSGKNTPCAQAGRIKQACSLAASPPPPLFFLGASSHTYTHVCIYTHTNINLSVYICILLPLPPPLLLGRVVGHGQRLLLLPCFLFVWGVLGGCWKEPFGGVWGVFGGEFVAKVLGQVCLGAGGAFFSFPLHWGKKVQWGVWGVNFLLMLDNDGNVSGVFGGLLGGCGEGGKLSY